MALTRNGKVRTTYLGRTSSRASRVGGGRLTLALALTLTLILSRYGPRERAVGGGSQARGGRPVRAAGRGRRAVGQGAHRKGRRARGELKKIDIWMEARGGQRQTQSSVVFYVHTRLLVSTHNKHIP